MAEAEAGTHRHIWVRLAERKSITHSHLNQASSEWVLSLRGVPDTSRISNSEAPYGGEAGRWLHCNVPCTTYKALLLASLLTAMSSLASEPHVTEY